jgi:transcriptional regulator of arginine metabolism
MKNSRHTRILEIINDHVIETQDDLIEKLKESGYIVTQATISRDIKQLGLIKTATKDGGYKYTVARNDNNNNDNKFTIMRETIRSVQNAQNIVVVKTLPGMANAAATSLDAFAGEAIVGSIAGDDTIFIVVRNNEDAEEFTNYVKEVVSL